MARAKCQAPLLHTLTLPQFLRRWNPGPFDHSPIEPPLPALQTVFGKRHTHTPPHTAWCVFVSTEQDGVTKQISKARLPHPQHIGDTFLPGTSPSTAQSTNIRPCLIVSSVQSSLDVRQARIWPLPSAYCLLPWMQEPCSLQDGSHAVPAEHCGCSHEPQRSLEEPQRRLASE